MTTRYENLPPDQKRLLPYLTPLRRLGYVLYGGTAIALQLGHRSSIDFDFFTDHIMDRDALIEAVPLLSESRTLKDEKRTWTVLAMAHGEQERPVKLSFFSDFDFGRVGTPSLTDGGEFLMASLEDLLGHKLEVLLQRAEAKDYQDIAAILENGGTLERGLGAALALFSEGFPPSEALRALVYFKEGDLQDLPDSARAKLIAHVDRFTKPAPMAIISKRLAT